MIAYQTRPRKKHRYRHFHGHLHSLHWTFVLHYRYPRRDARPLAHQSNSVRVNSCQLVSRPCIRLPIPNQPLPNVRTNNKPRTRHPSPYLNNITIINYGYIAMLRMTTVHGPSKMPPKLVNQRVPRSMHKQQTSSISQTLSVSQKQRTSHLQLCRPRQWEHRFVPSLLSPML